MATNLVLTGVDGGSNIIGFIPPILSGLVGWWWPGVDQATSIKNWAPGGVDASVGGSPTYTTTYANLKSMTNYLQTSVPDTASLTAIVVSKCPDTMADNAHRPILIGCQSVDAGNAGATIGFQVYVASTTGVPQANITMGAGYNTGSVVQQVGPTLTPPDFSVFKMIVGVVNSAGATRVLKNPSNGTSASLASTGTRVPHSVNRLRIGSSHAAGITGLNDCCHAAIYNRALSDPEITTHYTFVKGWLQAKRSITI